MNTGNRIKLQKLLDEVVKKEEEKIEKRRLMTREIYGVSPEYAQGVELLRIDELMSLNFVRTLIAGWPSLSVGDIISRLMVLRKVNDKLFHACSLFVNELIVLDIP